YGEIATSLRLWREVRCWKPTHLYVMNWAYLMYAAPTICALRLPLIYRTGDALPVQSAFHRWTCRLLFRRLTLLVCNSHFIERHIRAIAPADLPTRIIRNYPPRRTMTAREPLLTVPDAAVVVIYVGQVEEHKGVHLLVEAVSTLIRDGRNLALLVTGESRWNGALVSRLRAQVRM